MLKHLALSAFILLLAAMEASAITINHNNIAGVALLPQSTMDAIGQQKWYFAHASVGVNMIDGMNDLHAADPTRYQLQITSAGAIPPSTPSPGTVYEDDRGNPGSDAKFSLFQSALDAGWRSPSVDFAMDKLCFIDPDASFAAYRDSMSALNAAYPETTLVYTTMPLTTDEDGNNVLRNEYNDAVRNYCLANNKLLFDIADIEAFDPSGIASTFTSGGSLYQKLYDGYSSDGGHLTVEGRQQVARGWYAAAATAVVPEPSTIAMLLIGGAALAGAGMVRRRRSR
jgi:hypothetical protein